MSTHMRCRVLFKDVEHQDQSFPCACGQAIHLRFNGGELDRQTCPCGRKYYLDAPVLNVTIMEPYVPFSGGSGEHGERT